MNTCRKPSGKAKSVHGVARVVDPATNAKLKVTFFWPFAGDYWVLALGPEYQYAVVGTQAQISMGAEPHPAARPGNLPQHPHPHRAIGLHPLKAHRDQAKQRHGRLPLRTTEGLALVSAAPSEPRRGHASAREPRATAPRRPIQKFVAPPLPPPSSRMKSL